MSEEQYEAEINNYDGAAQMEAEMQAEAERQDYLNELIYQGDFELHGLYVAVDVLQTEAFKNSGLSAVEFLQTKIKERESHGLSELPAGMNEPASNTVEADPFDDLPF